MNKLYVVGIGPGAQEYLLPEALKRIREADVLVGGRRNLEPFKEFGKESLKVGNNLDEICGFISSNIATKRITVVVTGDPGLYSIMDTFKKRLKDIPMEIVPGISSFQYLCSKLGMNWDDLAITSLHGREQDDFHDIVGKNRKTAVFTGGESSPEGVCRKLIENGIYNVKVTVGENLTYENERIVSGSAEEIGRLSFEPLSIMIIENPDAYDGEYSWTYESPGIPDEMFIRGSVPMTKEEIRTLSVSKLRLLKNSIVWDIGAGTGSVSVECALKCRNGKVFAVEKNPEGAELIKENSLKFGAGNIEVICGEAPAVLDALAEPDRVFIGGSSGSMDGILEYISNCRKPVRVVVNAVTVESVYEAVKGLEGKDFEDIEVVNVSIARGKRLGGKHLMQALNPVYVISAEKKG